MGSMMCSLGIKVLFFLEEQGGLDVGGWRAAASGWVIDLARMVWCLGFVFFGWAESFKRRFALRELLLKSFPPALVLGVQPIAVLLGLFSFFSLPLSQHSIERGSSKKFPFQAR